MPKLPDSKTQRSEVMLEEVIRHRTVHLVPTGGAAHTAILCFRICVKLVSGNKRWGQQCVL